LLRSRKSPIHRVTTETETSARDRTSITSPFALVAQVILASVMIGLFANEVCLFLTSHDLLFHQHSAANMSSLLGLLGTGLVSAYLGYRILRERTVVLTDSSIRIGSLFSSREFAKNKVVDVYWVQKPDSRYAADAVLVIQDGSSDTESFHFSPRSEAAFDHLHSLCAVAAPNIGPS
jgi:hypothetical protein